VFFQPLVKHFVQLAQQGFADQNLLNKALSSLNGLRGSLVDNKQALTNAYETEKSNNEQIHEEYQQKLHDLSDVVIPQLLEDIAQKNGTHSLTNR
jgi:CHASE3 domain sensor protein